MRCQSNVRSCWSCAHLCNWKVYHHTLYLCFLGSRKTLGCQKESHLLQDTSRLVATVFMWSVSWVSGQYGPWGVDDRGLVDDKANECQGELVQSSSCFFKSSLVSCTEASYAASAPPPPNASQDWFTHHRPTIKPHKWVRYSKTFTLIFLTANNLKKIALPHFHLPPPRSSLQPQTAQFSGLLRLEW